MLHLVDHDSRKMIDLSDISKQCLQARLTAHQGTPGALGQIVRSSCDASPPAAVVKQEKAFVSLDLCLLRFVACWFALLALMGYRARVPYSSRHPGAERRHENSFWQG